MWSRLSRSNLLVVLQLEATPQQCPNNSLYIVTPWSQVHAHLSKEQGLGPIQEGTKPMNPVPLSVQSEAHASSYLVTAWSEVRAHLSEVQAHVHVISDPTGVCGQQQKLTGCLSPSRRVQVYEPYSTLGTGRLEHQAN
jgi:hypothetical protein